MRLTFRKLEINVQNFSLVGATVQMCILFFSMKVNLIFLLICIFNLNMFPGMGKASGNWNSNDFSCKKPL